MCARSIDLDRGLAIDTTPIIESDMQASAWLLPGRRTGPRPAQRPAGSEPRDDHGPLIYNCMHASLHIYACIYIYMHVNGLYPAAGGPYYHIQAGQLPAAAAGMRVHATGTT